MKDYVNSAALQEYTTKLVAKLKTLFPGTPTAAATVADMTDHSKTYVYVGSETGYTAGDWYYWNGTAWTSGGPFQATSIITDTTLAVAGEAADAKATGDAIAAAKTAVLNAMAPAYSPSGTYAVGVYVNHNGAIYRCTTAITTAEAWTAGHWTEVPLGTDLADQVGALKTQLDNLDDFVGDNSMGTTATTVTGAVAEHENDILGLRNNKVNQPLDENNQPTDGENGQLLRSNGDGSTEWTDYGAPTQEQVNPAVEAALEANPDWRAVVDDGTLTEAKFSNALKLQTIKDYVTPEMFGAVGDGITDDSTAVANAIASKKTVIFFNKYKTAGFRINENQHVINFGTITLTSPIIFSYATSTSLINSFQGGNIEITNTPAFNIDTNQGTIRRFTIKDVTIYGTSNQNCKAITVGGSNNSYYACFADIENIKLYNCYSALYGSIRASKIDLTIEQCYVPIVLVGDLNIITINGHSMNRTTAGNDTIIDLTGTANIITSSYYDVGGANQNIFLHIRSGSKYNVLNYNLKALNTVTDTNEYRQYWGVGSHDDSERIDKSNLTDTNIVRTNIGTFNLNNFLSNDLGTYCQITKTSGAEEGTIDIILPQRKLFFGFKATYFSGIYTPAYFEIYKDDVLVERQEKCDEYGILEWYPKSYTVAYSGSSMSTYKIRLGIVGEVRQFQINFYGK